MFVFLLLYEFITDSFDGSNMVVSNLTADLPDVHIHGPLTYMGVVAPDVIEDLIPAEQPIWFGGHQRKDLELLPGQLNLPVIFNHGVIFPVDGYIIYGAAINRHVIN